MCIRDRVNTAEKKITAPKFLRFSDENGKLPVSEINCGIEAHDGKDVYKRQLPFRLKLQYLQTAISFRRLWKTVNVSRILPLKTFMQMVRCV